MQARFVYLGLRVVAEVRDLGLGRVYLSSLQQLEAARKDAEAAMRLSKQEQAREGDVDKRTFKVGDRVWISTSRLADG